MAKFELFRPQSKKWLITQGFGENLNPLYKELGMEGHNGIDYVLIDPNSSPPNISQGQPVYATHDGVCFPEIDGKGGNGVVIRTNETYDYNGQKVYFKTIYWHLLKADAVVKTGQQVKAGDIIGYCDTTGLATGPHLHFGLKPQAWNENDWIWYNVEQNNGYFGAIDPTPFFNQYYAEDAQKVIANLEQQISLLGRVIELLKGLFKGR